jgi:hypothetical protein
MGFRLQTKMYPLKEGEGVDDVCLKIKALAGLPISIETITITKRTLKAEVWVQDVDPMVDDIPAEDPITLDGVMSRIDFEEVQPDDDVGVSMAALRIVADMLVRCRRAEMSGIAWVTGDVLTFCKWLNVKPAPIRFLEIPVFQYNELGDDKLALLGGSSSQLSPTQARYGIVTTMVLEERDANL